MIRTTLFLILIAIGTPLMSQPEPSSVPVIGEPMPGFTLHNVFYYKEKTVNNDSFKGRWLLLHFWSLGCSSAVQSLSLANSIQSAYGGGLQVMLVGHNHGVINDGIKKVFDRKRKAGEFNIPVAYDTILYSRWELEGVPVIYIVDPEGILRHISPGSDLTLEKVGDLIAGKKVSLRSLHFDYTHLEGNELFNRQINFDDVLYLSVLTHWNGEYPRLGYELDRFVSLPDEIKEDGWSVKFATLTRLYQYAYYSQGWFTMSDSAYYGKVFEKPILEVSDKAPFTFQDFETGQGYYNYFLKLPLNMISKERMMHEMQETLRQNFGYKAEVENRELTVWRLVAGPKARNALKTKGGVRKFFGLNPVAGVKVRNYPINDFFRLVTANLPNDDRIPYLNSTGIDFCVDANIQTDMTDFTSVQNALNQYGLSLVKGTADMKVLVIRDNR